MNEHTGGENVGRIISMNGEIEEPTQLYIVQPEEDPNERARKRMTHNSIEKKRKDKIRFWINKIGELLPPVENINTEKERVGRSTLEIVETAWEYITQLKAQTQTMPENDDVLRQEIQKLKTDLERTKLEKDRFVDIIRSNGLSTDMTPGLWAQKTASPVLSTISINNQDLDPKKANKTRKRNTISQQLEIARKQQEESGAPNIMQINNQNMLMNPMQMMNNQVLMQNQAGFQQTLMQGQGQNEKDQTGADLLQGAMQESGITIGTSTQSGTIEDLVSQNSDHASALQTLASVASQNLVSGSTAVVTSQSVSTSNVAQSSSVTTVTTQSNTNNPIMATGQVVQNQQGMMPFMNGQQAFPGNVFPGQGGFQNPVIQPQQQIMFINEQGIPCIANVPIDPSMLQNKVATKTEPSMDPNLNQQLNQQQLNQQQINQQQINLALQSQLAGLAPQNQVNMAGGLLQQQFQMNQQLLQGQLGATMNQQSLILPVSQPGNLLPVNNVTNQSQLPQALILPNGQIVPVVTNPQMISGQNQQMITTNQWRPQQPQTMTSAPMQILQNPTQQQQPGQEVPQSFGLLMTTNSTSSQSSPRSHVSIATMSSTTSSTLTQSVIPNQNKTVDSMAMSQDGNKPMDQVTQAPNTIVQQPQNAGLIPISMSQAPSQFPKPGIVTTASSQPQQGLTGNAPILINMVCNGQPTSILVDPTTMQVLGTVQTQQPPTNAATATVPISQASQQQTPPSSAAKKSKKKAPLVICPKPSQNGSTEDASVDTNHVEPVKKTSSKSKAKAKKSEQQDNTDILAKAAQSIFSSEISPGNFYNPANEDNPLQIDTSATEAEEEGKKSPQKEPEKVSKVTDEIHQDEVTKLIEDQIKQVDDQNKAEKKNAEKSQNDGDIVNKLLNQEVEKPASVVPVPEVQKKPEEQPPVVPEQSTSNRKGKKSKKTAEPDSSKESEAMPKAKNRKVSGAKKAKVDEVPVPVSEPKELPEEITFSENDISSVLDQVEGLGSPTKQKTKSKKTKSDLTDLNEPLSKKRKQTPSKSKVSLEPEKPLVAKPVTKSVYDFEEEEEEMVEDFSTPLFGFHPLRGSATTSTSSKSSEPKKETKSSKKSNDKKKPKEKEVKLDDSLLSPASDDLQINLDIDKSKDEALPFGSPTKSSESSKSEGGKTQTTSKNDKSENSLLFDKRTDYPNLEISTNFSPGNENLSSGTVKPSSNLLSQTDIMPLDISTGNASNDSTDIDTAMNSILGFSTNSLSPHIVSPKPRNQNSTPVTTSVITPISTPTTSTIVTTSAMTVTTSSPSHDLSIFLNSSPKPLTSQNHVSDVSTKQNSLTGQNKRNEPTRDFSAPLTGQNKQNEPTRDFSAPLTGQNKQNEPTRDLSASLTGQNKRNEPTRDFSANDKSSSQLPSQDQSKKSNDASKQKSIYSADNFVQSSRSDLIQTSASKPEKTNSVQSKTTASNMPVSYSSSSSSRNNRSDYNDRPNTIKYTANNSSYRENSPVGFNFANMGLNLSTTAQSGSFMESLNMPPIMSTTSSTAVTTSTFTFTLSSVKNTISSSNAPSAHQTPSSHAMSQSNSYPAYPPSSHHHSPGSAKSYHGMNLSNFEMDLSRNMNSQMNRNSVQSQQRSNHDRIPPLPSQNNVPFPYGGGESCSMREQQREPPRERTPVFQNITATTPPLANKPQSDQIRNTQKQIQDLSQNHNVPPKSHSDMGRNMNTVERSSNNMQPFFPTNPLNTPPLHHPPIMSDNNRQNIGGRSSYEPSFPPGQSQGYNSSSSQYNRYESNSMPYSSHNSSGGTQPLSHTPPSSDGRKSANAMSSNSKPSANQANRAMSGPSPGSGPTPPVSNRHTPPQAVQPPPPMSKSQRPPAASSNSKKSKQSQKRSKQPSYELESMPYPYFDPNRMTPFLGIPPQPLSPPSRNVQPDAHLFSGNFLSHSSRPLSNSASSMNKNSELGGPFNSILPPSRGQNGFGLNFQPGFGMNSMHPSMSNAPSLTPHSTGVTVTPHMSNFSLSNIFPDTSQSDSPINFSPIKFHGNQIMEGNPHHQGSALFHPHNRSHPPLPNAMSINSILGHNHHGFDTRQMSQGMNSSAPPFGGHGHPPTFGMHPF